VLVLGQCLYQHAQNLPHTSDAPKKKKDVTRVAHAATLQLNPAMEGYSQYEKGNHQDKPHP
jgi:hypothetical protein